MKDFVRYKDYDVVIDADQLDQELSFIPMLLVFNCRRESHSELERQALEKTLAVLLVAGIVFFGELYT